MVIGYFMLFRRILRYGNAGHTSATPGMSCIPHLGTSLAPTTLCEEEGKQGRSVLKGLQTHPVALVL